MICRWVALTAVCAVTAGLIALPAGLAHAAPLSDCTADRGTIVAVDFAHWGGPVVRGCGVDQASGYDLLHAAGFTVAGDEHDGPAVICRIGDQAFRGGTQYPTPREDACIVTPPASAYWSFWVAPAGSSTWAYSPLGAMGDVPKPGEVELWIFGATNIAGSTGPGVPAFSPSTLRTHPSSPAGPTTAPGQTTGAIPPTTTRSVTTSPATTAIATTATAATGSAKPESAKPSGTAATRPAATAPGRRRPTHRRRSTAPGRRRAQAARPRRSAGPERLSSAGSPAIVTAKPTSEGTSSGSALPLIIGIGLAVALCGAAGWAASHRRRYG